MESHLNWCPASTELTLEAIFQQTNKKCFLIGSGISLGLPSGLPTGYLF